MKMVGVGITHLQYAEMSMISGSSIDMSGNAVNQQQIRKKLIELVAAACSAVLST